MSDLGDDSGATSDDEDPRAFGARAPWARKGPGDHDEVRHSALVGYMSVPVHPRFPIRRSTLLMAVVFLGLGTLLYFHPAQSDTVGKGAVVGGYYVPGAVPVSSTTTSTSTPTSTTTSTTTTTRPSTTTTTRAVGSTTTTAPSTSTTGTSTTTTLAGNSGGTTTTTTQSPGGGTSRPTTTTTTRPTSTASG